MTAILVLEDGRTFTGDAYGARGETFGEAVFATGMTGYQETLTDPSYHRQVVVQTAPHIGNTGVNDEDPESRRIWVAGYVVRDPARRPSNWRAQRTLDDELRRAGHRRHQRHRHPRAHPAPARARRDAVRRVVVDADRDALLAEGARVAADGGRRPVRRGHDAASRTRSTRSATHRFTVAALDYGIKAMTPHRMAERGITTHVLPSTSTADDVVGDRRRRGVPGQRSRRPGHRRRRRRHGARTAAPATSRSSGSASATRCSAGRSASAPTSSATGTAASTSRCRTARTGKVEITAHNHGFAVDAPLDRARETDFGAVEVSHVCLNDDVVEGLSARDARAFSVQYHPEAAAGPHDAAYLFDRFVELLEGEA